jgi:hypothetical protein
MKKDDIRYIDYTKVIESLSSDSFCAVSSNQQSYIFYMQHKMRNE